MSQEIILHQNFIGNSLFIRDGGSSQNQGGGLVWNIPNPNNNKNERETSLCVKVLAFVFVVVIVVGIAVHGVKRECVIS